ncbi:chaperone modulator CbpM [Desulfosediminicola flagellatus]|uniref:chaperone modulator CbpM n=1 Tax=Desulfosediminicola flagellatus TaxID=2569541 RepID=UPI0010ACA6D3|nr:chaperone modulator CbpM [Desulfosediminicola flagellatus]
MTFKKTCTVVDDSVTFNLVELCRECKVKDELVYDMINEGILTPTGESPKSWIFTGSSIKKVQITVRLQEDLRVNLPGAALAIELLEKIEVLRAKVEDPES